MEFPKHTLADLDRAHLWHPFTQHRVWEEFKEPLVIGGGEGMELIDVEGNRYLDGVASLWCNVHGHSVPELCDALHQQVDTLCHSTLLGLSHVPAIELTQKLLKYLPSTLTRVFFSDSGSAAVEAALRMAVEYWQKQDSAEAKQRGVLAALDNGYHGDTLGSIGLGYLPHFHASLERVIVPSRKVRPPHIFRFYEGHSEAESLKASIHELEEFFRQEGERIAAFVFEPLVQGAAGVWVQPPEYAQAIERVCREYGTLLVCDEVATGFLKTGSMFAIEQAGITPDLLVMGKGLSGGYLPISAVAASEQIFEGFLGKTSELKTLFFGQTFCGNPLAARVSSASLDLIDSSKLLQNLPSRIKFFQSRLAEQIEPLAHVDEVRTRGLMCGVELTERPGERKSYHTDEHVGMKIVHAARAKGVIIRPLGNVIILMPAPAMREEDLARLVDVASEAIREVTEAL